MAIVIVNPKCCGGTGLNKWEKVRKGLAPGYEAFMLNNNNGTEDCIKENFEKGSTNFIAAGGDGTVNLVLNKLLSVLTPSEIKNVKLGAIGLGSSNDFHKPNNECTNLTGIPARINFEKSRPRDVGCITYMEKNKEFKKYFLINASVGITAEANNFFNHPDNILTVLKKWSTSLAILYAAVKTIFSFHNFTIKIQSAETGNLKTKVTNLGITKNPNFSGSLRYKSVSDYSSGYFDVFLCADMNKREIFSLLSLLGKGKFDKVSKKRCWETKELTITSEKPFHIEFDGEIIKTNKAVFSVLHNYLQVCTC